MHAQFNFGGVHYLFIKVVCTFSSFNNALVLLCVIFLTYMCCPGLCLHGGWLLLKCSAIGIGFNGAECTHFRHPTDEQLGHVDIFFSNYYNLQSVDTLNRF